MHVVFDESNPLDPRKDMCSVNDIVDEFLDMNIQEENASKTLELKGPRKEESEERPQPTLKDDL